MTGDSLGSVDAVSRGEAAVKANLRAWVMQHTRLKSVTSVSDDVDLISQRIIDSLRFVELVLQVEEMLGRVIEEDSIRVEDFRTIDAIWSAYFA